MTDYIRKLARNHDLQDRIGSGYSGTLKNFCNNGPLLKSMCYRPVMQILRDDNLPAVISAMRKSGWDIIVEKTCSNSSARPEDCAYISAWNNRGKFSSAGSLKECRPEDCSISLPDSPPRLFVRDHWIPVHLGSLQWSCS
jgi:hypothetical protein